MHKGKIVDGVQEITLDSWSDFHELNKQLFAISSAFVYRGHADYSWALDSSIDRHERKYPKRKHLGGTNPEFFERPPLDHGEQLKAFKRAVRGRRGLNPPKLTDDEYWALGQHHGLCTPLLDFSRSPYAALYFAFEAARIIPGDSLIVPEFRGVYALSTYTIDHPEHPPADDAERIRMVSPEGDDNIRLLSQVGLFAKLPRKVDVETYVRTCYKGNEHGATLTKIKIPSSDDDRRDCLVALSKMNVNRMTLFPDVEGAALHVNSIWAPGHEDSLPYV